MERMSLRVLQKQITCPTRKIGKLFFFSNGTWSALSNNVISQDYKYWYSKNPHPIHEIPVHVLKIGAWCAVFVCKIIRAMFLKERISDCYTQLIQNHSSGN
jgi:hypothetical protein